MAARNNQPQPKKSANQPLKKIGPYKSGLGCAVWENTAETKDGPQTFYSITINARRYRDPETGEWRDSHSFHPEDLPLLQLALGKAFDFCVTQMQTDRSQNGASGAAVQNRDDIPY